MRGERQRAEPVQDPAGQADGAGGLVVEVDLEMVARCLGVPVGLVGGDGWAISASGALGVHGEAVVGRRSPRLSGVSIPRKNSVTHCSFTSSPSSVRVSVWITSAVPLPR